MHPAQIFKSTFFVFSFCLLAEGQQGQQIIPGIYGDEEWQANQHYEMNAESFWVVVNKSKTSTNGCFQDVAIGGKGVYDIVKLECTTIPIVYADKHEVIVGNKVYSVNDGSLIFINQDNSCVKKSYFMNKLNQLKHVDSYLSAAECTDIRRKMKQVLTEIGHDIIGEQSPQWKKYLRKLDQEFSDLGPSSSGNSDKPNYNPNLEPQGVVMGWYTASSFLLANGQWAKIVHVKPPGTDTIGEQFLIPAAEKIGLTTINGIGGLIGNSFFSDTPNTLVVLSGDRCILRRYYGKAPAKSADITGSEKCQMIRSAVIRQTGKAGSNVVVIGGKNQKAQAVQASQNNQVPQSNQASQISQKPQSHQTSLNNQKPQSNQASEGSRVTKQLIMVAETLQGMVNKLANTPSASGQPNGLLLAMGDTLSRIAAYLKKSEGSSAADINFN